MRLITAGVGRRSGLTFGIGLQPLKTYFVEFLDVERSSVKMVNQGAVLVVELKSAGLQLASEQATVEVSPVQSKIELGSQQ